MICFTFMYTCYRIFTRMCSKLRTPPNTDIESDFVIEGADPEFIYNYVINIMSLV